MATYTMVQCSEASWGQTKHVFNIGNRERVMLSFISARFLSKLLEGKRILLQKKRKGKPFAGAQRYGKNVKETPHVDTEIADPAQSSLCDETPTDAEFDQTI